VQYLSALEVCLRLQRGTIQIHADLYLYIYLLRMLFVDDVDADVGRNS